MITTAFHQTPQLLSFGSHCRSPSDRTHVNHVPSSLCLCLQAHTSIRFGIGRFTTEAEVDRAVELTVQHVNKVRWGTRMGAG